MKLTFLKGAAVGAITSVLTLTATAALAGTGVGAVFNLGKTNKVNATSTLTGSSSGSMLKVTNSGTGIMSRGIRISNASGSAPAIDARNTGNGPAAVFTSPHDVAVMFNSPPFLPPFTVTSDAMIRNLDAEFLNGLPSSDYMLVGSTAANSDQLGGVPASGYQRACGHGSILAFAHVPASPSFSATYASLAGGFSCAAGNFAKRVAQGDYRVLVCGIDGTANPIALVTDTSFSNFAGIQLVPADPDATATCQNLGASALSEFKVTTRDTSGVGLDEPFNFAQLGS
jgi:hypothetical protein